MSGGTAEGKCGVEGDRDDFFNGVTDFDRGLTSSSSDELEDSEDWRTLRLARDLEGECRTVGGGEFGRCWACTGGVFTSSLVDLGEVSDTNLTSTRSDGDFARARLRYRGSASGFEREGDFRTLTWFDVAGDGVDDDMKCRAIIDDREDGGLEEG